MKEYYVKQKALATGKKFSMGIYGRLEGGTKKFFSNRMRASRRPRWC